MAVATNFDMLFLVMGFSSDRMSTHGKGECSVWEDAKKVKERSRRQHKQTNNEQDSLVDTFLQDGYHFVSVHFTTQGAGSIYYTNSLQKRPTVSEATR